MPEPTAGLPVTVKGVCVRSDGRVLLCRNHRGEWELPGGRPEADESWPETLRRELVEETGLMVDVERELGVRRFEVVPGRWVDIVAFACACSGSCSASASGSADGGGDRADGGEGAEGAALAVSDEHAAVAWLDLSSLDDDELPAVYRELIALR